MQQTLSVAIITKNEEVNLGRTLASVPFADEIIVLDSGSTDRTVEIARAANATVYLEPWKGYGAQVNSALDKCSCTWILNLDADEVLTPELAAEIQALLQGEPEFNAYTVPRLNNIFGRWMRHGGLYPDRKLRLFRKGAARLAEDTEPHATPKTTQKTGRLNHPMLHWQYPTVEIYIQHMNTYSTATIPLFLRSGKASVSLAAFLVNTVLNPLSAFFYNYVVRGGFLDGREGLLFHLYHASYTSWKYAKAWQAARVEKA
jgi:glycosyltransferase involved in cell wall biosynthesis